MSETFLPTTSVTFNMIEQALKAMPDFNIILEAFERRDQVVGTMIPWVTKERIELFSRLPLDVVRLVFEKTMEDKPRPLHLVRVSRQTQHWLEPLIYEHVSLHDDRQFEKFYRTFRERRRSKTKDPLFFQRHVKTFFVCAEYPRAEKLTAIIQQLTGLRALACWDLNWGSTAMDVIMGASHSSISAQDEQDPFPFKNLRRISFSASLLAQQNVSFTNRMFRNLTHMDIYFDVAADWESLRCLSNLTHLSLDMVTEVPTLGDGELDYWFSRILRVCPPSTKVVIFGCVDESNTDFDLVDSDGDYLPPGWPPRDQDPSTLDTEGTWDVWLTSESKCHDNVDIEMLHPISRLAFGKVDPRAVAASVTSNLPENQLFREYLVYFVYPDNRLDWDGTDCRHRDCWTVAEDIIEKRKGLTYSRLVSEM